GQRVLEGRIVEDVGCSAPHLQEPEPGNRGPNRVVVGEDAAGVLGADVMIRAHDERAFGGVARAREMPGLVFRAVPDVKDIRRARRVVAPLRERGAIDRLKTCPPGEDAGSLAGTLTGEWSRRCGEPRGPPLEGQALESPAAGAIPERIHLVGHTG